MMDSKSTKRKLNRVYSNLAKAVKKYNLIQHKDKIMVGISGGKDSMVLLDALAQRQKYSKEKYELVAAHINIVNVPYSIDEEFIANYCKNKGIKFIVDELNVDFDVKPNKSKCFVCSWHRRKRLFELTEENNCNKLALGHHMDDALETMILNMCYHASLSSMPAKLSMFNGRINLIRPLILLSNNEIASFAKVMNFLGEKDKCPYEDKTKRKQAAEIIHEMETRFKPARKSLFKSMSNIYLNYLPIEDDIDPIHDEL